MTVRFGPVAKICQPAINGRFWHDSDEPITAGYVRSLG